MLALRRTVVAVLRALPMFVVLSGTDVSNAATGTRVQRSAPVRSVTVDRSVVLPIPPGPGH